MAGRERIALFGGTFNPVHYGHLRCAEEVSEGLSIDKVLFIVAATPPHKEEEGIIKGSDRIEMVRLAVEGNPRFEASDMELTRGGTSYTVDTLTALKEERGDVELTLIIGADSFNDISTWCDYERIFSLADVAVAGRPGAATKPIADALPVEVARKFCYDDDIKGYTSSFGGAVFFPETTRLDISSTAVRSMVKGGSSVRYLLPPAVDDYIRDKGLYGFQGGAKYNRT